MSKLIVLRGLPGSGKTTWARQWVAEDPDNRVRVNRDDLRMTFYGKKAGLSQKQETQVTRAEKALVREYLNRGFGVVVDAMNLSKRTLEDWNRIHPFQLQTFSPAAAALISRNSTRPEGDRLPDEALTKLVKNWYKGGRLRTSWFREEPFQFVPYDRSKVSITSTPYIICDLDGTLAIRNGRSPYDYSRVHEDTVNGAVADVLDMHEMSGGEIVFVSGREDACREATVKWLCDNGYDDPELHMREAHDKRDDTLVKYEIFDRHLRNRNILFSIDDRDRVVQMWRKINVPCFQVNEGDF